jgi:hypothetical protein
VGPARPRDSKDSGDGRLGLDTQDRARATADRARAADDGGDDGEGDRVVSADTRMLTSVLFEDSGSVSSRGSVVSISNGHLRPSLSRPPSSHGGSILDAKIYTVDKSSPVPQVKTLAARQRSSGRESYTTERRDSVQFPQPLLSDPDARRDSIVSMVALDDNGKQRNFAEIFGSDAPGTAEMDLEALTHTAPPPQPASALIMPSIPVEGDMVAELDDLSDHSLSDSDSEADMVGYSTFRPSNGYSNAYFDGNTDPAHCSYADDAAQPVGVMSDEEDFPLSMNESATAPAMQYRQQQMYMHMNPQ